MHDLLKAVFDDCNLLTSRLCSCFLLLDVLMYLLSFAQFHICCIKFHNSIECMFDFTFDYLIHLSFYLHGLLNVGIMLM
jgi:hypothetical protein